jgi:hypothetical protein
MTATRSIIPFSNVGRPGTAPDGGVIKEEQQGRAANGNEETGQIEAGQPVHAA